MISENKNDEYNLDNKETNEKGEIENNKNNEAQKSNSFNKDSLKELPSYEYIRITVQKEIQQGLLYISKNNPKNPIKFLGEFLLEKSKNYKYK